MLVNIAEYLISEMYSLCYFLAILCFGFLLHCFTYAPSQFPYLPVQQRTVFALCSHCAPTANPLKHRVDSAFTVGKQWEKCALLNRAQREETCYLKGVIFINPDYRRNRQKYIIMIYLCLTS
jgi:hypothetical protein